MLTGPSADAPQVTGVTTADAAPVEPVEVVLVDDHGVVRAGVRALIEAHQGYTVVSEVSDIESCWREVALRRPAVLVLDLNLRGVFVLDQIPDLLRASPSTMVVVLTMQEEAEFGVQALAQGARAYVLKDAPPDDLVRALDAVVAGALYLDPRLAGRMSSDARDGGGAALTEGQRDVLALLAAGFSNQEIAARLHVSVRTVETRRARIRQVYGLNSRAELVELARRLRVAVP